MEYVEISPRVQENRRKYRNTKPKICIERYKIVTDFFKEHPEIPAYRRKALMIKELCEKMPVIIYPDEILVGAQAVPYRGSALYPEVFCDWFGRTFSDPDSLANRSTDPYDVDPQDAQYVVDTVDFWMKHSFCKTLDAVMPPTYAAHEFNGVTGWTMTGSAMSPIGHVCPDYSIVLDRGLASIRDEAQAKLDAMDGHWVGDDAKRYMFYTNIVIAMQAVIDFSNRYGDECERLAQQEADPARKAELLQMADTLHWIFDNPCRTMRDAVQAEYFYQMCICLAGQHHGNSLGRCDQHFGKYYEADLAAGRITPQQAQELIDTFVLKIGEMNKMGPDGSADGAPGYTSGQLITVGGVDSNGDDATNEVTYMFLQTAGRLLLHDPPMALRISDKTPERLWDAGISTTMLCGGVPTFQNDGIIIPALRKRGLPLEVARQYCLIGCLEPMPAGYEFGCSGGSGMQSFIVLPNALLQAIHGGVNPMPRPDGQSDVLTGLPTKKLYEMQSFQELLDAFKQQLEYFCDWWVSLTNLYELEAARNIPLPLISATTRGCMEQGADVMDGGALFNSCGVAGVGIGNTVDSLNIIKHLCFDTKQVSTREMYDALCNNWEGYEELKSMITNECDHYGNGIPEVDWLMTWVGDTFCDKINAATGPRGGYAAGIWPVTMHVVYGRVTAATPDGRSAGEPLSDGIGPVQATDTNGPTALIRSAACLDQSKCGNGTLLNMRFHPTALQSPEGRAKLEDLMKTYFELDGMQLQINVVSTDTLRAAQEKPENFKDLVVRIAGFSAYFVEVNKPTQDDLIRRTEMSI